MATGETKLSSWARVLGIACSVGAVSLIATELMHFWLVPDLGRNRERLLAEAFSALIVTGLVARLAHMAHEQHRVTVARIQVIDEMNHHIRNALAPIALSMEAIENQQLIRIISDGVDRIDWALREILPREKPFLKEERYAGSVFFPHPKSLGPRKGKSAKPSVAAKT
jgi:hypothetical protein